jgi:hypothetical protein
VAIEPVWIVEVRTILARTNASTIAAIIECFDEGKNLILSEEPMK